LLCDYDKDTFPIGAGLLPFTEGLYRVTGYNSLRVAANHGNLGYDGEHVDYPPFQLEFVVSRAASPEPEASPETQLGMWELPEIEDWQWYTWGDCAIMYEDAGFHVVSTGQGQNGLLAVFYHNAGEGEHSASELLRMDVFDRKTGMRYEVFDEPTVVIGTVVFEPCQDGFIIGGDDLLYCFIDGMGNLNLEPVVP